MKKFLSMFLVLAMMLSLAVPAFAAEPNKVYDSLEGRAHSKVTFAVINDCDHEGSHWIDNGDGTHTEICDGCGEIIIDHEPHDDINGDGDCDICGSECTHPNITWTDNGDGTHDGTCDKCHRVVTDDESHIDENDDRTCDKCGATIPCGHDKGTVWVDNGDGTHDEVCNGCGGVVTDDESHIDIDDDGICDKCDGEMPCDHGGGGEGSTYWVDNGDGTHDEICSGCGGVVTDDEEHEDGNGDKECDKCGALMTNLGPVLIATVPLKLPIIMDLKGNVTVADNAVVQNHVNSRAIAVTDITLNASSGWTIGSMSDDFNAYEKDSKILAMSFRQDTHDKAGAFALSDNNWNIAAADSLKLNMAAKVPVQTKASDETEIADVEFVLNWAVDKNSATSDASIGAGDQDKINAGVAITPEIPETPETPVDPGDDDDYVTTGDVSMYAGDTQDMTVNWTDPSGSVRFASLKSMDSSIVEASAKSVSDNSVTVGLSGLAFGKTNVIVTLSNGNKIKLVVSVSAVDEDNVQVRVPEGKKAGDSLTTGEIQIIVPVNHPDGTVENRTFTPNVNTTLNSGNNTFNIKLTIGSSVINVQAVVVAADA